MQAFKKIKIFCPLIQVPTIQLSGFGFAFWVAMTRITDNQHHPGDVIAGSLLGIFIQVLLLNSM